MTRRHMRRALGVVAVVALPLVWLVLNLGIDLGLPWVLNRHPERLSITWDTAWMSWPGRVHIGGLRVDAHSPTEGWTLAVAHIDARLDVGALLDSTLAGDEVVAEAATFHWSPIELSARTEAPARHESAWRIDLRNIAVDRVQEIELMNYRFVGDARATGTLLVHPGASVEVENGLLDIDHGEGWHGATAFANELDGVITFGLEKMNPHDHPGREALRFMTTSVEVSGRVEDLSFLDVYFAQTPWLGLSGGEGRLDVDVNVESGVLRVGSRMTAIASGLVCRFLSYAATGDGVVQFEVAGDPRPETRLDVAFNDFVVTREGDDTPLLQGHGLEGAATTPNVALEEPLQALQVSFEIPASDVPDVSVYDADLPQKLGLRILSGRGLLEGRIDLDAVLGLGSGDVLLRANDVSASWDGLSLRGDMALHAVLTDARIEQGTYDLSDTNLDLRNVSVRGDGLERNGKDDSRGWWATVHVDKGHVATEATTFLDASLSLSCRDSIPFVTMLSQRKPLPGWLRGAMAVDDLAGAGRIRISDGGLLELSGMELRGASTQVLLHLSRKENLYWGRFYARRGSLSLGVGLLGAERELHLAGARKWFDHAPSESSAEVQRP